MVDRAHDLIRRAREPEPETTAPIDVKLRSVALVVIASAEEPIATAEEVAAIRALIAEQRPELPVIATTFRPHPIERVAGKRVFFATTAPPAIVPRLAEHLSAEYGCEVAGTSSNLSNRARLRADMAACAGGYDVQQADCGEAALQGVARFHPEFSHY